MLINPLPFHNRRADTKRRNVGAFFKEEIGNPIESLHNKDNHVCLHLGLDLSEDEHNKVAATYSPGEVTRIPRLICLAIVSFVSSIHYSYDDDDVHDCYV